MKHWDVTSETSQSCDGMKVRMLCLLDTLVMIKDFEERQVTSRC